MQQIILPLTATKPKFWKPTTTAIPQTLIDALVEVPFKPSPRGWLIDIPQLSAGDYRAFRRILTALRGRYQTGGQHLTDFDASDLLAEILSVGKLPALNPFQLHQTPAEVVDLMMEICPIDYLKWKLKENRPVRLLEPSAGLAAIAGPLSAALPAAQLDLFEIDYLNRRVLQAKGFSLAGCNWLAEETNASYDLIVMNPEFRGEAYLFHIEKAFSCLKVGGFFATIVPVGFLSSTSIRASKLRETFAEQDWGVEPIGSPFQGIDTECLIVYGERLSQIDIEGRRSVPREGYDSCLHRQSEICLSADSKWYESSKALDSIAVLRCLAFDHLLRLMSEQYILLPRSKPVCDAIAASRYRELSGHVAV